MEKLNEKLKKRISEEITKLALKKILKTRKNRIQHLCFRKKHYCKIQRTKIYQH